MRILLADPPRKEQYYDLSYPNVGILYLVSYLRRHYQGEMEVRYLEGQASLDDHIAAIAEFKPDIYGISFALWTARLAQRHSLVPDKTIEDVWSQNMLLPGVCESQIKAKLRKGMPLKSFYLLKNGKINLRHGDRIWRNLKVLLGGRLTKA
ncbi:MAG: cobalamin B12-binding domain-containing protein [Proteobacteria bacterium]|nr:cobalamin B12-binding domain-containing protein [Pseudomonadota bacterium]MBU1451114.1 cobalamin B12-binding domain-containing protein [Pseudomonadota bacterium]MBU2469132.1 cobalamin B12-binding domain-containing protein [Pseudomonadota bacterium]MBU2517837.1 cobalamin B12-binding domain-containing protein [Pseudomonadota bacterium]